MIDGYPRVLTIVAAIGAGLAAGVFFAFSTFVMTALRSPSRAAATSVRARGKGVADCQLGAEAKAAALKKKRRASAGERTRTSKGFRPTGPKPVAFANSATPA